MKNNQSTLPLETDSRITKKHLLKNLLGYFIALVCLVWIFQDFEWHIFLTQLKNIRWHFIWLAIFLDISSYISQGWRLQLLLGSICRSIHE
jgi:uncharacterized membrane protein YbhN (UPF0104 family)